jgi:2-dehydropantoate 2-reductase
MTSNGGAGERVLVMGTGALGAFFGGRLAQAGVDVVFVARGATLEALRRDGLRIESAGGVEHVAPVRAVGSPAEAGPCGVVLVCVKSYDTDAAAAALRPAVGADTIVLSLQNGIENEARLAAALGLPPLLGGLTHIGAELVAPGVVHLDSGGRIIFGEPGGAFTPRVGRLQALFGAAGIDHRASRHIAVMQWDKLAWNAAFNAATAITRRTVGALLTDADGHALVRAAMLEVVAVAQASGVPLETARVDEALRHSAGELAPLKTSMLQDRQRGRRLEYDALNGAVLRAAARHGVAVPVNRVLHDLLAVIDARRCADHG